MQDENIGSGSQLAFPQARLVQKYDANTALYECSPPMKFMDVGHPLEPQMQQRIVQYEKVVVHSCLLCDGYPRTVIHSAETLQGGSGTSYGAGPSRVLDGVAQHSEALAISGYRLT